MANLEVLPKYIAAADIKLNNLVDKDVECGNQRVECAGALLQADELPLAGSGIELAVRVI